VSEFESDSTAIVLPASGVLVNLESEKEVAIAFRDLRELKTAISQAERRLKEALLERSHVLATKTFHIEGVGKVELRGSERVEYDAKEVEDGLRALGCPEEVIREIVVETVTYKVDGNRARRAAAANPEYARVIENARTVVETLPSVLIT
jgi:hypothetical protein